MSIFQNQRELLDIDGEATGRSHVLDILEAGILSVLPEKAVGDAFATKVLKLPDEFTVLGWGKASLGMFSAFKNNYQGEILGGHIISLPEEEKSPPESKIGISSGAHPLPDETSLDSGRKLLAIAEELKEKDTLVCLISGGGSSMFEVPKENTELENLRDAYKLLLESGADIHEMNSVRRALSSSKGGGLARVAYPAKVINIVISDVPGNNLEDIASGATVEDPFRIKPQDVVKKYDLEEKLDGHTLENIESYRPIEKKYFRNVKTHIIADNDRAQEAMLKRARSLGYKATRFGGYLHGEARLAVKAFMETEGELIVGGGETTVTVKGGGRGGRNQEFVLAGLQKIKRGILASCGTDGIDGTTKAAGAIGDKTVLETARARRYDMGTFLENNDSYGFFKDCGGLLITGPTGTNVADISVFLGEVASS
ncbi:MAG: DUF4147 domain-containing protein [Methanomassiliicoccales archaeon]|nr:MAG: DUF4147 domain-containing protein [Methanomassiliicoccales archaeon]